MAYYSTHIRFLLAFFVLVAWTSVSSSTSRAKDADTFSGIIKDIDGRPVPGVTVLIMGTTTGTITDTEGLFKLEADEGDVLVFSSVGFQSQTITLGSASFLEVILPYDLRKLEEVVVVGYGTQKRKDLTGAIATVKSDEFNVGLITSPEQLIQGQMAGVDVYRNDGEPGAGINVRIRGNSSIRSGNTPLFVVDGYPLDIGSTSASGDNQLDDKNPLNFLNPGDIESIDVLKDASATAIYGSRGANGVVIITTKRGKQDGFQIQYNNYFSTSRLREKVEVLSASEFRQIQQENDFTHDNGGNTDWQDEMYRTAFTQNHELSFSGGTGTSHYRASLNAMDQVGILKGTGFKRYSARIGLDQTVIDDRLSISFNLGFSRSIDSRQSRFLVQHSLSYNPTIPVFEQDGNLSNAFDIPPPASEQEYTSDIASSDRLLSNISAGFALTQSLTYRVNFGIDHSISTRRVNESPELINLNDGYARISERELGSLLIEHFINYAPNLGDRHSLNAIGGYSYQSFDTKDFFTERTGFQTNVIPPVNNISAGTTDLGSSSGQEKNALQSFFARVNYAFDNRFLITATVRADGSTKFGDNNKYGVFPSIGLGWNLHEEGFLAGISWIDQLKLRTSWGITGNQEIPNKISQQLFGFNQDLSAILDEAGTVTTGIKSLRTPNPNLRWEQTEQVDFGLDFNFFNGRLSGSIDYFNKSTEDLLFAVRKASAPTTTGFTNIEGKIINKGVELYLEAVAIRAKDFTWTISTNLTSIKNNVEDLPFDRILFGQPRGGGFSGVTSQTIENGAALGSFYGKSWLEFDEEGNSVFEKSAEDDQVDALTIIGNPLPDYSFGITNRMQYKNIDLSFLFNGVQGNEVNNNAYSALPKANVQAGFNTTPDRIGNGESFSNSQSFSDRFLQDGSYVRLSYFTIGYSFNVDRIKWLNALRLYVTGNNLWLLTDYVGYDPEVSSTGGNQKDEFGRLTSIPTYGGDFGAYPRPRSYLFGLIVNF